MAKTKAYFGLGWLISIILHIFVGYALAPITRLVRGNIIGAIISFFLFFIFYWVDLFTLIVKKDITVMT